MAKKKKSKKSVRAMAPTGNADADIVHEAYRDGLKQRIGMYFTTCDNNPNEAETNLVEGLKIIRTARDRALELV